MIEKYSYEWFLQDLEKQMAETGAIREDVFFHPVKVDIMEQK